MRAVITGANRGIGAEMASQLRDAGHNVIGTSRGGAWPLDVTDPESICAFASQVGPDALDLLVCNAGVYLDKGDRLENGFIAAKWAESFAVNVTGVFLTVQAMLPALRKASAAKIAIISSQMASHERAPGGSYIYRASKAAVLNVGRNLASDLKADGIAVGIYHPGWVQTDMGGANADIDAHASAAGLIQRFDALSIASTGCFETWDGRPHPY